MANRNHISVAPARSYPSDHSHHTPRNSSAVPGLAVAGRALLLVVGLVVVSVVGARWAVAAGAEGQGKMEPQSTQVTEETKVSIREDIKRLKGQLAEYRKNHAPMQKVYLTMRALLIDYSLVGEAQSPDALAINKEADHMQQTYPEVLNKGVSIDAPKPGTKALVPKDVHVMGIWGTGKKVAIKYQYRIEFYTLPADLNFKQTTGKSFIAKHVNNEDVAVDIAHLQLQPTRVLSFKNPVDILPGWPRTVDRMLVCTNMLLGYVPVTIAERSLLPPDRHSFPWKNAQGAIADFCGVVSIEGKIIWKLNYKQVYPERLLQPVAISKDGQRALIYSGSLESGEEGVDGVGKPRNLFLWTFPDSVKKMKASDFGANPGDFLTKFQSGEIK